MALSPTKISKLLAAGEACRVMDEPGLYLDIRSATSASWLYRFTFGGRPDEVGLGSLKKVDLEAARNWRRWCLDELNADRNPRESMRARKLEVVRKVAERPTLRIGELVEANVDLIAPRVTTNSQRKAWVYSMQERRIGRIATMYPHEVTKEDCRQLLEPFYARAPVMADDIRQRLAATLAWAAEQGMIQVAGWTNPCVWRDVDQNFNRKHHEEKHHAALAPEKVGEFIAKVRACQAEQVPAIALEWVAISAVRLNEGCAARWDEIDWERGTWTVPVERLKVKRRGRNKKSPPHVVPLTKRHYEILEMVMPPEGVEKVHVFTCYGRDVPVSTGGARKVLNKLRVDAAEVTSHGFRATFKTWAQSFTVKVPNPVPGGAPLELAIYPEHVIERAICHIKGDPYGRGDFLAERRPLMEAWAAYCGIVQAPKVVQLPTRRPARRAA